MFELECMVEQLRVLEIGKLEFINWIIIENDFKIYIQKLYMNFQVDFVVVNVDKVVLVFF